MSAVQQVREQRIAVVSGFIESLQEPRKPYISLDRLSAALGVKRSSMAALTGMHRNTLRNPASERLQDRLREMVRVITAAVALTSDVERAVYWFRNEPIADYGYKTASELVAEGHAAAVMSYLRDLENGANG